jgi:hypothetical protein
MKQIRGISPLFLCFHACFMNSSLTKKGNFDTAARQPKLDNIYLIYWIIWITSRMIVKEK